MALSPDIVGESIMFSGCPVVPFGEQYIFTTVSHALLEEF